MEEFTLKFDEFLNKLNPSKYDMYIMGDMNINLLNYHSHQQTERYLDMIYSLDFSLVITKPTSITNHTVTLIDLIYTNNVNRLISGIVTVDISDHLPVFCLVDTPLKKQSRQNTYFRACLHEGGGSRVGEVTRGGLPHLACKRDHIKMRDYMDRRVTPPKQVTSPIWGTPPPCKQPVRDYSKFNTESYLHDIHTIDWNAITEQCSVLHEVTSRTIDAIELIVEKHAPKRNLSKNQQLIKRKTKSLTTPLRIARNNKIYTNEEDIADQVNKHFINVGPNLASKIDKSNENPTQYISSSSINSFVIENVTEAQVSNLFKNLDTNKSSIDIPNKQIKMAAEPLSQCSIHANL